MDEALLKALSCARPQAATKHQSMSRYPNRYLGTDYVSPTTFCSRNQSLDASLPLGARLLVKKQHLIKCSQTHKLIVTLQR